MVAFFHDGEMYYKETYNFFRNDEYMRFESCTLISVKLVHQKTAVTVFEDFELSPLSGLRFS